MMMSRMVLLAMVLAASGSAGASTFEWVKGTVTTIASQVPTYTVATVNGRPVRFCDPETGADYALKADNTPFDLLKIALLHGKSVEVGGAELRQGRRRGGASVHRAGAALALKPAAAGSAGERAVRARSHLLPYIFFQSPAPSKAAAAR
jgi:hypothetical protein